MLEEFLGKGQYFSFNTISQCYPNGLKKIKRIRQNVRIECRVDKGLAIDKLVKKVIAGNFDFSKYVTKEKDFYKVLCNLIMNNYIWNHWGSISRPVRLKVDPDSLKLKITDVLRISSKKDGNYTMKTFEVKFDLLGTVQYGGIMDDDQYDAIKAWAMEKLPKTHTDQTNYSYSLPIK